MDRLIIAIDGYSACGKSTLAKGLAECLNLGYIDTGAMYRAVTLYFLRHGIDMHDTREVEKALDLIDIHFERVGGENHCFLNDEDVEEHIRSKEVSDNVSEISTISSVRKQMVALQRKMGDRNVVLDGRDIGSVVFPNAAFKFFVTASIQVRAERRFLENKAKGINISMEDVKENLLKRDHIDSTREDSPLKISRGAFVIDNSFLDIEEQLELLLKIIKVKQYNNKRTS